MNPNINPPVPCETCSNADLVLIEMDQFVPSTNPAVTVHPYKWVCGTCKEEQHGYYKTATEPERAERIRSMLKEQA